MLESSLLGIAFIGSVIAALYDLKTTEVPDWVFYFMLALGLPTVIADSVLSQSIQPFLTSAITGLSFLAFGFLMYKAGQWGGADALILALIGFLVPKLPKGFSPNLIFPFPVSFLFNVFLVGAIYMIFYAIIIAIRNKKIIQKFSRDLKASSRIISIAAISLFILFSLLNIYLTQLFFLRIEYSEILKNSLILLFFTVLFFIIYKFACAVENIGLKKRIPISRLKIGDMLLKRRELKGVEEEELRKIKKSGKKFVWIKEGVCFAPAFSLALLFTLFLGDGILLIKFFIFP